MFQDDDFEAFVTTPERIQALGFKPQKEILTNHLLPYADQLDDESTKFLEQVKTNLAKAVMLREMKPACGVWTSRLMKYISIFGLKFSKEDHIAFIKLAYELVLIPDLEPCKVHKFATMFLMLTKKRSLISPEELTLPWRPLHDIGVKIFDKSATNIGMYHYLTRKSPQKQGVNISDMIRKFMSGSGLDNTIELFGLAREIDKYPTSLEGSYISMVKCAKPYFDINATQEILDEFLPIMFPWTSSAQMLSTMINFLPVTLPPKYAKHGHELWFDKLMAFWDTCFNTHWVSDILISFAGLAKKNPGAIDWTPHVPTMFVRFLHSLNLPVSYKDMQYSRSPSIDMKYVATWIVWTINPDGVVLKHLKSFLAGMESYMHSANAGRWSFKLRDLLKKLAREFLNRYRREREPHYQKTWENQTPETYKLRDEDVTEFVNIVLRPSYQAVYSKNGALDISLALQHLATLRPAIVIPPLLEKLRAALTSVTEPHRVTSSMAAVAAVARPMLRGADNGYPEGPTHVVPFLVAVLPGLDPNDLKKTLLTLHFILIFSNMVPIIDCSKAHEYWPDLTEEELLVCESTAQFEDFVLIYLDRVFNIIESSVLEQARLDTKDTDCLRSKADAFMESALSATSIALLDQCSPKIFKEALRKFKAFATETTFETNVSGSLVGVIINVFARVDAESTLAAFLPKLLEEIEELISSDEALKEENPPRDLVYRLVLLMQVVRCDGSVLLKYVPKILPVLDRIVKLHTRYALSRACEVLSHIQHALSYVDPKESKSSPNDYGSAPEKWLPIREWGRGYSLKDINYKWHVPSAEEAECAQMISDRYLKHEVKRLEQWMSGERPMCKERRLRSFHIMDAVLSCTTFLPQPDETPISMKESQVPAMSMPFTSGVSHTVTLDGENMRVALTKLLLDVQRRLLVDKSDDIRGMEMLLQVWERVIVMKGHRAGPVLEVRIRSYGALERALDERGGGGGGGGARLRMLVADAVRLQDESRLDLVCDAGITPSALRALQALYELSINPYSMVRILAQIRLYWMLSHYPYSYRALIPRLVELLSAGGEGDEWHARHKGALFIMLGPKNGPLAAKHDWEVGKALWPAMLRAPLSEKPSIHRLEQTFSDILHRHFPVVNTRLTISDGAIEAAKKLLNEAQINDPEFKEQLDKAIERETANSDKAEKLYNEFIEELVDLAENCKGQWRRLEIVMQMLTYLPLVQTRYPPRAVRFMARALIHDDITVRRHAARLTVYALKQRKNALKKIKVDPYEVAGVRAPQTRVPGYRKDLEWAMWSQDKEITTDEEWDKPWLRNFCYGFYSWPKELEVAAPISEQKYTLDTPPEDMEEGERYLYEFFTDEASINKLMAFLTVEEKKGKDKFSGMRYAMFRFAFTHFGERVAKPFLEEALRCAATSQEAPQRFAAEIASAALRAPRYWPRRRAHELQRAAMDIVELGLTTVTPETVEDWATGVATGADKMDPTRGAPVLRRLLALCAPSTAPHDTHTSFLLCARLYALQGTLGSLSWRATPLASELLKRLDKANFIQHPYQNVRESVGSLLMTIFDFEVVFPGGSVGPAPLLAEFLASVKPRLTALYDENGDIVINSAASSNSGVEARELEAGTAPPPALPAALPVLPAAMPALRAAQPALRAALPAALPPPLPPAAGVTRRADHITPHHQQASTSDTMETEREEPNVSKRLVTPLDDALRLEGDAAPAMHHHATAVNLLTTVLRGCMGMIVRGVNGKTCLQYRVAGAACAAAARGPPHPHEELPRAAAGFLASLALVHHSPSDFDVALQQLEDLAASPSWWARLACLDFAQPLLFYGLPMLRDRTDRAVRVETFTFKLMRDGRVEVRKAAAKLLTGLMHCNALLDEEKTIKNLTKSCRSKQLVERHCGVLGLCAYLASRPYSLGPRLGVVLAELARHTGAPEPVPGAIRAALADFRRTHQDDWPRHRDNLTEEELDLLADLTSPPSYCA